MKQKAKKPYLGRIPISKPGGPMKSKSVYTRRSKHQENLEGNLYAP